MLPRKAIVVFDALTLVCAVAAIGLALFGAFREYVFGLLVSLRWFHAAFAAVAIGALRHLAVPTPSLLHRLRQGTAALGARPALRDATLAFWLTRPTVLLVGLVAVGAIGVLPSAVENVGRDPVVTLPARYDSGWYVGIASDGYEWQHRFDRQQNLAFFPAYPMLMRAVGVLAGAGDRTRTAVDRDVRYAWTGLVISLVAFFWAAWYLARIARELLDDERATAAVLLLAAYPFSIFYSAAYTESLFLLCAVGAWYHFRHGDWTRAALFGLVAGLSRPNGFMLSVPLGLLALGVPDAGRQAPAVPAPKAPRFVVAAMPVLGMLIFTAYVYYVTEIWFAWARLHGAWGRTLSATTFPPLGSAPGLLQFAAARPFQALNTLGVGFALALAWPVWRKLGTAWAAFIVVNIIPPLFAGGVLSMGRVTSTLFPLFLALAAITSPRAAVAWAAVFGILQGLAAALFFTWRELF